MPFRPTRRILLAILFSVVAATAPMAVSAKAPAAGCHTGSGMVFFPNPIVSSGDETLTDRKDSDYDLLNDERVDKPLTALDGSGYLRGTWAVVINEVGDPAYSSTCTYNFTRHDDGFEQVMAYYWVTKSQDYLHALGFDGGDWPLINGDQQRIRINQWGVDNSYATDHPKDEMRFGKGGVDDAEDAEVILHELGHQIHFSQSASFFDSNEGGSISEGFGDYWAADVVEWALGGPGGVTSACIMDWDATSYTSSIPHCLRTLNAGLTYPDDLTDEVHHDGKIWSQALWDLRTAIGPTHADTAILWAQFGWGGANETMTDLATLIVAQAQSRYGQGAAAYAAFAARGILS